RAEDGNILQAGNAVQILPDVVLDETRHYHGSAARQLHGRLGAADPQRRDRQGGVGTARRQCYGAGGRDFAHLGRNLAADPPLAQEHRREREADAEWLEFDRDPVVVTGERDREPAAGMEIRGLAGDCRERRLRQGSHQPVSFHRPQDVLELVRPGQVLHREVGSADGTETERERIDGGEPEHALAADIDRSREIDAELLDDRPLHLGNRDPERHLLATGDRDHVQHPIGLAGELRRDIRRLLRVQRARYRTRQNHVAVDRIDGDRVVRQDAVEHRLEREQIALDLDFEIEDLAAVLVEEEDVRLTDLPADQVDGALGTDDGLDNCGARNENVTRFLRQVHDQRLVQGY